MRIRCSNNKRGFEIPKTRIGKAYNGSDVILELSVLVHRKKMKTSDTKSMISKDVLMRLKNSNT